MIRLGTAADRQAVAMEPLRDHLHPAVPPAAVSNGQILFFEITTEQQTGVS